MRVSMSPIVGQKREYGERLTDIHIVHDLIGFHRYRVFYILG